MEDKVFAIPYETVEDIPLDAYEQLFRDYWNFIADNKLAYKPNIVNAETGEIVRVDHNCFACEYDIRNGRNNKCPVIDFRSKYSSCSCGSSEKLFGQWCKAVQIEYSIKASNIAKQIANLEWEN